MPAAARKGDICSGDGCFPPTPMETPPQGSVYVNGKLLGVVSTTFPDHSCGDSVHTGRNVTSGSGSVNCEGQSTVRISDPVSCGAVVAQGSGNVFIGG